jgi:hypothetical protein
MMDKVCDKRNEMDLFGSWDDEDLLALSKQPGQRELSGGAPFTLS